MIYRWFPYLLYNLPVTILPRPAGLLAARPGHAVERWRPPAVQREKWWPNGRWMRFQRLWLGFSRILRRITRKILGFNGIWIGFHGISWWSSKKIMGFNGIWIGFCGIFMGFTRKIMGFNWIWMGFWWDSSMIYDGTVHDDWWLLMIVGNDW